MVGRADRSTSEARLERVLVLGAVLFYCFGDILGAGIYALVGKVAGVAGALTPLAFLLACALASLTALDADDQSPKRSR